MTSDLAVGRRVSGSVRSVRQRLAAIPRAERWLGALLLGAIAVHGARALAPFYARGDLLYHWGLTNTILLGTFPPEGPYAGLPSYYPPGFHLLLAGLARLLGTDAPTATAILGLVWLPVIPLGAYLLTRRLTGRRDVALVAAVLTAFAGGFDLSADRLWVNSMFMVGQAFYPVYPRDLVFGLLPFAMLAFLRATDDGSRALAWAALAGLLLGLCGLLQVQLLIPIPLSLAILVVVLGLRHPGRWRRLVGSLVVTGLVARRARRTVAGVPGRDDPLQRRRVDRFLGRPAAGPDRLLAVPHPVRPDPPADGRGRGRRPVLPPAGRWAAAGR